MSLQILIGEEMKIELEYPYNERWCYGYIVTNGEDRKTVVLFNTNDDRSSTAYARYKLAVSIGRFLTTNEQADHIDDDKTNDDISNLQILSRSENIRKQSRKVGRTMVEYKCPICESRFMKRKSNSHLCKPKTTIMTCSRVCGRNAVINPPINRIIMIGTYQDHQI